MMEIGRKYLSSEGDHVGAIVGFKTEKGEVVHVKVAHHSSARNRLSLNLAQGNWE